MKNLVKFLKENWFGIVIVVVATLLVTWLRISHPELNWK